ncbi:hypothetical protein Sjap_013897 [Stephania japonica]|uniref:Uncharacterized protein n=1 Tax=Stephania japonica TaxID=461633 RepID=A0AAP0IZK0_9MAGN
MLWLSQCMLSSFRGGNSPAGNNPVSSKKQKLKDLKLNEKSYPLILHCDLVIKRFSFVSASVVCKGRRYDFLSDFVPEKVRAEDALLERLAET